MFTILLLFNLFGTADPATETATDRTLRQNENRMVEVEETSTEVKDTEEYGTPIYADDVVRKDGISRAWIQLIFEDFESGSIPADWTIIDGAGDGYTWQIYSTATWGHPTGVPADSGQYIVGYDDYAAGTNYAVEEELILPAIYSAGYDSLMFSYSFGSQNYAGNDTFSTRIRTHDGVSWSSWSYLALYDSDMGSGLWEYLDLTSYLPADSVQVEFNWMDNYGGTNWYASVDNISVMAFTPPSMHDIGVQALNSPPAVMKLDSSYAVSANFRNYGDSAMTFDARAEIADTAGTFVFEKDTTGLYLMPDSSMDVNFGNWMMTVPMQYNYTVSNETPDSTSFNDAMSRALQTSIDIEANEIVGFPYYIQVGEPFTPTTRFINNGVNADSFVAYFRINDEGSLVYEDYMSVILDPGMDTLIDFATDTAEVGGRTYDLTSFVINDYDGNASNDTVTGVSKTINPSYIWDFETGWQGWTHTNGLSFPAAWDVQPAMLHDNAYSPHPGDSSMWMDGDSTGGVFRDTALSPVVGIPSNGYSWLKMGYGYQNYAGNDTFAIGIKVCSADVWMPPVTFRTYDYDIGPEIQDSFDLTPYNSYDSLQIFFAYYTDYSYSWWASFDNVMLFEVPEHDAGVTEISSPIPGGIFSGDKNVIATIANEGGNTETFDVTATVYDTTTGSYILDQTVTLTNIPPASDTVIDFGSAYFDTNSYFLTKVYTSLSGDVDPTNDTLTVFSRTILELGDVVFEMDAETLTTDVRILGIEFDGEYFYHTGSGNSSTDDTNYVHVVDTAGNLIRTFLAPAHVSGWGWRDLTWDETYRGPDRIDTLYASFSDSVDKFSIDFVGDSLIYHGAFSGPISPNRALAYLPDSNWYYTASFSSDIYRFSKTNSNLGSASNSYAIYGAAYDTDSADGGSIWWHSQDDPGTGFDLLLSEFDPLTMSFTGNTLGYTPANLTSGMAGGLCFHEGFRGADIMFALVQGTPHDEIVGIYVRSDGPAGVGENTDNIQKPYLAFPKKVNMGSIRFTYHGRNVSDIVVRDIVGRTIKRYRDVKPETRLEFGRENSAGIYFFTIEGTKTTDKVLLFR